MSNHNFDKESLIDKITKLIITELPLKPSQPAPKIQYLNSLYELDNDSSNENEELKLDKILEETLIKATRENIQKISKLVKEPVIDKIQNSGKKETPIKQNLKNFDSLLDTNLQGKVI